MSLVTRCPACGTPFKVVRDQLRISDGWVRCGRCSQVFDAMLDLQETAPAQPPATKAEPDQPSAPPAPDEAEAAQPAPEPVAAPQHEVASTTQEDPLREIAESDFLDDEQEQYPNQEHGQVPEAPSSSNFVLTEAVPWTESEHASPSVPGTEFEPEPLPDPAQAAAPHFVFAPALIDASAPAPSFAPSAPSAGGPRLPFADFTASWPEAEALLLGEQGRMAVRPPPPPPLSFPVLDLSVPRIETVVDRPPANEDAVDNTQFAKALRRARAKSAKIAKARARSQRSAVTRAPLVLSASEPEVVSAPATLLPSFSLVEDSVPRPWWHRLRERRSLIVIAVVAALLLVVQVLHQERDLIAARQPSLRPLLAGLCSVLGCELSPLRRIEDIKIDGASFTRAQAGDGYQLSFTLRNSARLPLAMPAVELTLLDTQERPVVRRVLMPSDFGAPAVLEAGAERNAALALNLGGAEATALPPVVGFRVEALYP